MCPGIDYKRLKTGAVMYLIFYALTDCYPYIKRITMEVRLNMLVHLEYKSIINNRVILQVDADGFFRSQGF